MPLRAEGGTLLAAVDAVDWCNDREGFGNSCFMAEGSLPPSVIIAVDEPGVRRDLEIEPPATMPGRGEPKGVILKGVNQRVCYEIEGNNMGIYEIASREVSLSGSITW